jgi:hypothetical protein
MTDLNKLSAPALSAAMKSGTKEWGEWGSAEHHVLYIEPIFSRRKCRCGCKKRVTHRTSV